MSRLAHYAGCLRVKHCTLQLKEGDYKAAQDKHIADEADLKNEEAMIRMIMRYIGILHDVKATEKSIAAGGRESVKNDKGISNPYESDATPAAATAATMVQTKVELEDTVDQLSALMSKSGVAGEEAKVALLAQKASLGKRCMMSQWQW